MPRVVRQASDAIGPAADQPAAGLEAPAAAPEAAQAPEVKIAEPVPPSPTTPEPGFESPPTEKAPEDAVKPAPEETPPSKKPSIEELKALLAKHAPPPPPEAKSYRFVNNKYPDQVVTFLDGTKYRFKGTLLVTGDEALAQKILEVADVHSIVQ